MDLFHNIDRYCIGKFTYYGLSDLDSAFPEPIYGVREFSAKIKLKKEII